MTQLLAVPLHNSGLLRRFIRVPWMIHREHAPNTQWVPPLILERKEYLDPKKNPLFDRLEARFWLATDDSGRDIGRIAAVIDREAQRFRKDLTGNFGMFECVNDPQVAAALLGRAKEWLASQGCDEILGPMNLAQHHTFGVLIDNFDRRPSFNMPYNPPYYPSLIEQAGFSKAKDVYQWGLAASSKVPERVQRIAERIKKRDNIQIRNFDFDNWDRDVALCLSLYNDAWRDNWGFVPVSLREFSHMAKDLKLVLEPTLGIFLEVDGKAVAVAVTIKDLNPIYQKIDGKLLPTGLLRLLWDVKVRPRVDGARLMLLGIDKAYRRRGLDSVLYVETHRAAGALGYENGQIGWTLEDNDMINRAIVNMGAKKIGSYRLFTQAIEAEAAQEPS